MLLVAACRTYDKPVPEKITKDWDIFENTRIRQLRNDEKRIWSLFRNVGIWLPFEESFLFSAPLPIGYDAMIGTLAGLEKELIRINELAWQASVDRILS